MYGNSVLLACTYIHLFLKQAETDLCNNHFREVLRVKVMITITQMHGIYQIFYEFTDNQVHSVTLTYLDVKGAKVKSIRASCSHILGRKYEIKHKFTEPNR